MNYGNYMHRIEQKLGQISAADRIQEEAWFDVFMRELNEISRDCARELQIETGGGWKKLSYVLGLDEAPPTRLLALEIALASWLGWIMHEKHGQDGRPFSVADSWKRIEQAYQYGVQLSKDRQRP